MPRKNESDSRRELIRSFYSALYRAWGPQHWWPAETPFEVITGAFLTQNTAWTNVSRAIANLRAAEKLDMGRIRDIAVAELEQLIRPAGYFRQKAARLKSFIAFLDSRYQGSLVRLFAQPTGQLRSELLGLNGIGPETADSILLYAGNHPVFVVDAYTRRIFDRHAILPAETQYEDIRALVEDSLCQLPDRSLTPTGQPSEAAASMAHVPSAMSVCSRTPLAQAYNEMHALIVAVGKNYCLKAGPKCEGCPLQRFLPEQQPRPNA